MRWGGCASMWKVGAVSVGDRSTGRPTTTGSSAGASRSAVTLSSPARADSRSAQEQRLEGTRAGSGREPEFPAPCVQQEQPQHPARGADATRGTGLPASMQHQPDGNARSRQAVAFRYQDRNVLIRRILSLSVRTGQPTCAGRRVPSVRLALPGGLDQRFPCSVLLPFHLPQESIFPLEGYGLSQGG